jgi:hypothetical protein
VISFAVHLLKPHADDREFKPPSMQYLLLPALLLLLLSVFLILSEFFWAPVALVVFAIWVIATTIVVRCIQIAPTLGWQAALVALVVAMTLPSVAIVHIARQSALRLERCFPVFPSPEPLPLSCLSDLYANLPPNLPYIEQPRPHVDVKNELPDGKKQRARTSRDRKYVASRKAPSSRIVQFSRESKTPVTVHVQDSDTKARDQMDAINALMNGPAPPINSSNQKVPDIVDLATSAEFTSRVLAAAVCVGLCFVVMIFNWLLDFGFDVLHYGGNEKHRTALVNATVKTIRWFHEQAPNSQIIVVGHSLGSVIAAQAVTSISAIEPGLDNLVLVTLGSPLNYLCRAFRKSVPSARFLSRSVTFRWVNLWRHRDPIGKSLELDCSDTVQYCVGSGGHANYWSDGRVWRAVAHEALQGNRVPVSESSCAGEQCVFERHLGALVCAAIVSLLACGLTLWHIAFLLGRTQ